MGSSERPELLTVRGRTGAWRGASARASRTSTPFTNANIIKIGHAKSEMLFRMDFSIKLNLLGLVAKKGAGDPLAAVVALVSPFCSPPLTISLQDDSHFCNHFLSTMRLSLDFTFHHHTSQYVLAQLNFGFVIWSPMSGIN